MTSEVEERIHKALGSHPLDRIDLGYRADRRGIQPRKNSRLSCRRSTAAQRDGGLGRTAVERRLSLALDRPAGRDGGAAIGLHLSMIWWSAIRAAWLRDRIWVAKHGLTLEALGAVKAG